MCRAVVDTGFSDKSDLLPMIAKTHQCHRKDENRLRCTSNSQKNNFAALALTILCRSSFFLKELLAQSTSYSAEVRLQSWRKEATKTPNFVVTATRLIGPDEMHCNVR